MLRLRLLLSLVLISATANAATLRTLDRTLYIRSIPEVKGYNSHIYEVLMKPVNSKEEAPPARAVAALRDSAGGQIGKVDIQEAASGKLQLRLNVQGLPSGTNLGLSIHNDGDCSSLGPVFKPDQPTNAVPSPETPAGYLGTFKVDKQGKLELELEVTNRLALSGHRSVLARGVALHEMDKQDSSAAPVACGVFGRITVQQQRTRRHHFP